MENQDQEISAGFIRQRRNLFIATMVQLFKQTTDATLSQVNIQGAALEFNQPHVIDYWLWTAIAYFWIRYYQYYQEMNMQRRDTLYETLLQFSATNIATNKAIRGIKKKNPNLEDQEIKPILRLSNSSYKSRTYTYAVQAYQHYKKGESANLNNNEPFSLTITARELLLSGIKLRLKVWTTTTVFTEYYLPFCLPIIPLLYWLFD